MFILLALSLFSSPLSAEVYSSYANVKNLHYVESHLLSMLKKYIQQEEMRLDTLNKFREFVLQANGNKSGDDYVGYPTNQFAVIHRFVADWAHLEEYTYSMNGEIKEAFETYRKYYPTQVDIKGAAKALHRLQDIYKVSSAHFTQGLPLGPNSDLVGQPLLPKSLLALAQAAYDESKWKKCAAWAQQAYEQIKEYDPQDKLWFDVTDHLAYCLYRADDMVRALEMTKVMLQYYPTHDRLIGNEKFFSENIPVGLEKRNLDSSPDVTAIDMTDDTELSFVPKKSLGGDEIVLNEEELEDKIQDANYVFWGDRVKRYKKLCREDPVYPPDLLAQIHRLKCYYKQNTPRTAIKPIKVEEVFPSPRIWIFHDILSEKEADSLIALAQPKLDRATVHNKETGKLENADYRVSKTAWLDMDLPDDTEGVVRRLNRRMEDATELSHVYAELCQVNIYGMAGQYEPHYDMATLGETAFTDHDGGNRVATLLFYMGDTNAGGATTFVDTGARISPVKNAAVFWYNLLPNGDPDLLTRHAGCPVLAGTKWVMNKWFHVNDQIFSRPCDLDPKKRDTDAKLYKYTVS